MDNQFCYLLTLIIGVIFAIWGFFDILKEKQKHESDMNVLQRQLRGFGFLVLSQVVLVIGVSACLGIGGGARKMLGKIGEVFE